VSPLVQKVHHLLDVALLIIDGLVLLKYKRCALSAHHLPVVCMHIAALVKQIVVKSSTCQ
jgi:hypothetical protein